MNMLNNLKLEGRLTNDPTFEYLPSGQGKATFTIANERNLKEQDENGKLKTHTSFFPCVAWGKVGEVIAEGYKKGAPIHVEGRFEQRRWESEGVRKDYFQIVVFEATPAAIGEKPESCAA